MDYTRRQFLGTSSAALVGAGFTASAAPSSAHAVPPSDRLRFGVIGCNGMGWANMQAHQNIPGVDCIALCDVDRRVLENRAGELEDRTGQRPALYEDYRRLLDDSNIDFVIIATPDHWHCLPMVHACQAGKHVYVEKPLARTIGECLIMQRAARQYDCVVQVGQWQRSAAHWKSAIQYVKSGALGTIRLVKTWAYQGWMDPIPPKPDQAPPEHVNYDLWLGPAPERPFNPNRFHFNFRWYWDYAGGLMTDWGVHLIDFALYGMDAATPRAVTSLGGQFGYPPDEDASETPDTQQALYKFDEFSMIWEHATGIDGGPYDRTHGVAFIGHNGTLVVDRSGWEVLPEKEDGQYRLEAIPPRSGEGGLDAHALNFVASIRGDETPNCPVDVAANTAINAHLGNVAFLLGRPIRWDATAQQFIDDPEANAHIRPTYRAPWTLPEV